MRDEYVRKAQVLEVHDGDTFRALVDLGYGAYTKEWLRLKDVNAKELKEEGGPAAKLFLQGILTPVEFVWVRTFKTKSGEDKRTFVRYVAEVDLPDGTDVAKLMVDHGMADWV
jgi:endonuclease YncB( thermonuclease family)